MVTPENIQAIGTAIILQRIKPDNGEVKTAGGIILRDNGDADDNGFSLGLVLSVGKKVVEVKEGDYLIFRRLTATALPNGVVEPVLFRIDETSNQIVGRVSDDKVFLDAQKTQGLKL